MNILGCLDQPSKGHYRLGGVEVEGLKPDQLAEIRNRKSFTSNNLTENCVALETLNCRFWCTEDSSLKEQRARASTALERVGLKGREHHTPRNCRVVNSNGWPSLGHW